MLIAKPLVSINIGTLIFSTLLNSVEAHSMPLELTAIAIKSTFLLIVLLSSLNFKNCTFFGTLHFNAGCILFELIRSIKLYVYKLPKLEYQSR